MAEKNDDFWIRKCIELAKKGKGDVSPNPMVGAVLVNNQGEEVSCGYHEKYGEAHAEVNCLKNVSAEGLTLYVNLEPCSHFGKTPPCADLIIEKSIKKVVIGAKDPNPEVCCSGIKKLQEAGIEVISGVLENECETLNKVFFKNMKTQKPFVAIKTATTLDGKIATSTGSSKWITSENAREEVQKLRSEFDAILTGSGTVLADNPSLTVRNGNKSPIRIIIDRENKVPKNSKVFNDDGVKVIHIVDFKSPDELFKELYKDGITSVLVEAGSGLNSALIRAKEVDWLYQFIAPKILGGGKSFVEGFEIEDINDCVKLEFQEIVQFSPDVMLSVKIRYN